MNAETMMDGLLCGAIIGLVMVFSMPAALALMVPCWIGGFCLIMSGKTDTPLLWTVRAALSLVKGGAA